MSQTTKKILYIGHNLSLAQTMLDLSASKDTQGEYQLYHLNAADDLDLVLAQHQFTHLVSEVPLSEQQINEIKTDFPSLKFTCLCCPTGAQAPAVVQGIISDEVKAALDYLSIPIYFKNIEGVFLACNNYFSRLVGLSHAQIIGKKTADILPAHLAKKIEKLDKKIFTNKKVYLHESSIQDIEGQVHDVVFRKERVADSDIQIGIIFDVTEINETRSALEKERIMLRATSNISDDLIFFKDFQGRFLGCNKQFEKFVGCPEEQIIGKTDDQLFEFYQALMCQEQDRQVMDNNQVYLGEEYLTYKNGERHFIEMKKEALSDVHGQVQGLIGVGRDMTAHNILQKRLKIADTVFENSKECFLVTDEQGKIISVNNALCMTSGYAENELIGAELSLFRSNKHDIIEVALKNNRCWEGELNYVDKFGKVSYAWLEVYIVEHVEEGLFNRIYSIINLDEVETVEQKIQHLAKYDPLTGLYNRIALFGRLEDAISRSEFKEVAMAVALIDINGFDALNRQYGDNAGNGILKQVAERLKDCVFEKDTVARFGHHEFIILIDELLSEQDAAIIARRVAEQFINPFIIDNDDINLSAAIGIAMCPDDGEDVDSLIESAEEAKQRAKGDKGSSYHFYTSELTSHSKQQFELEKELMQAIQLEQFELYFQPQFDIRKRQIVAVESSLRWNHPVQGVLEPDSFLSLAENSGLLGPLSMLVIRKSAIQAVKWNTQGVHFGRVSIALSKFELENNRFIAELQKILLDTKCSGQWLEFAIDEALFITFSSVVHDNLLNISKMGISMMIDNYAADRPALYLIEKLGIRKLKLAKHFRECSSSAYFTGESVVNALSVLGRALGVDLVGNFVEDGGSQESINNEVYYPHLEMQENKVMKASETTFYLRCHKRK